MKTRPSWKPTGNLGIVFRVFPVCRVVLLVAFAATAKEIQPGELWLDTEGNSIQAHGGGILSLSNRFYWYGEDRTPRSRSVVACYSSTNLVHWKREGAALTPDAFSQIEGGRAFVERPKVIFNPRTRQFVMWMHLEQRRYQFARAGIATSTNAAGPFTFLQAIRPITNDFNFPEDGNQQKEFGGTVRDMNLFVDDDGKAYVYYASENNWTMYVVRLNGDFTGPELPAVENKTWARIMVKRMREGPAPFKHQGRYYLITSGCTGWRPNEADCAVARSILGPYQSRGNPCAGPEAATTYGTQSTFVLPMPEQPGCFIFMADKWNPEQLSDSRYVWLPFCVAADGACRIEFREQWSPSSPRAEK